MLWSLCLAECVAAQNTYYVKKTGSDLNDCAAARNPATPKLTMNRANECLSAGDIMMVSAGTYAESIGETFTPVSGANAARKTTYQANVGDTVILRPSGTNRVVDLSGSMTNIKISGFTLNSELMSSDTVKITTGSHDIDIIGCDINMGATPNSRAGMGILVSSTPPANMNVLIQNCSIHGNGDSSGAQDHQIYVSHTNNVTVDNCVLYDSTSHGIQVWDGRDGSGCNNIIIKNCIAHDCNFGFGVYAGSGNVIYNSIAYNNSGAGIRFRNDGGSLRSPAAYNNTISGATGIIVVSVASGAAVLTNNFVRSVFTTAGPTSLITTTAGSKNVTRTGPSTDTRFGNLIVGNWIQVGSEIRQLATITDNNTATVTVPFNRGNAGVNWKYAAPLVDSAGSTLTTNIIVPAAIAAFFDETNHDYHLTFASRVAKDTGTSLSGIFTTDKDGNSRPHGAGWDIGAYEFTGARDTRRIGKF